MAGKIRCIDDVFKSPPLRSLMEPLEESAKLDQVFRSLIPVAFAPSLHLIYHNSTTLVIACVHTAALSQGRFMAKNWLKILSAQPQFAGITQLKFVLQRDLQSENPALCHTTLPKETLPEPCRKVLLEAAAATDDAEISLIWQEMATRRP